MKKWNTPAIAELSIEATANGFWPWDREVCPLILGGAHDATGSTETHDATGEQEKGQEQTTPTETDSMS